MKNGSCFWDDKKTRLLRQILECTKVQRILTTTASSLCPLRWPLGDEVEGLTPSSSDMGVGENPLAFWG